jgi:hypothetical protein
VYGVEECISKVQRRAHIVCQAPNRVYFLSVTFSPGPIFLDCNLQSCADPSLGSQTPKSCQILALQFHETVKKPPQKADFMKLAQQKDLLTPKNNKIHW